MKLVLEIRGHAEDAALYHVVEKFPVTLGRAYDSDIILPDPHAGAAQARISLRDGLWMLEDANPGALIHVTPK